MVTAAWLTLRGPPSRCTVHFSILAAQKSHLCSQVENSITHATTRLVFHTTTAIDPKPDLAARAKTSARSFTFRGQGWHSSHTFVSRFFYAFWNRTLEKAPVAEENTKSFPASQLVSCGAVKRVFAAMFVDQYKLYKLAIWNTGSGVREPFKNPEQIGLHETSLSVHRDDPDSWTCHLHQPQPPGPSGSRRRPSSFAGSSKFEHWESLSEWGPALA